MTQETPSPTPTERTPSKPPKFTEEQKKALKELGCVVFCLDGDTIGDLQDSPRPDSAMTIIMGSHRLYLLRTVHPSRIGDVAVYPRPLPDSGEKTFAEQVQMVAELSENLGKQIPEVSVKIGTVADYAALSSKQDQTLLPDLKKGAIVTMTSFEEDYTLTVSQNGREIIIARVQRNYREPDCCVQPIIVPEG